MAGKAGSGPQPARMKMSDVVRYVGGVARGTRQAVRSVKIDAEGNMTMIMGARETWQPQTPQELQLDREAAEAVQISSDQTDEPAI
jgi:hypothetical protein